MQNISRRSLLGAAGALALAGTALAQDTFPRKPLALIVPYPAGGASDVSARIFGESIGKHLKQPVIVENVAGGTGLLGAGRVLNAPADGYTFFHGSVNEVILAPLLNPAAKYQPSDFRLAEPISEVALMLLVKQDLPVATIDEFAAYAQKHGKAQPLSFATVGIDSLYHLMGDAMGKRLGVEFLHVPFKGAAPALQGLGGGQVDFAILPYQNSMEALAAQGRFKIVSTFSRTLPAPLRHLPTIDKSKVLGDFEHTIGGGYFVRKSTPEAVVAVLRGAVANALGTPDIRARLEAEGRLVVQPMLDPAVVDAYFANMLKRTTGLLAAIGRDTVR